MKKIALVLWMALAALPGWAQSTASTGSADFAAERARLKEERKAVEAKFQGEQAECYKKFAVQGCLEESRRTRRMATDDIKRQEAAMNDADRQRRGAAQVERLDQKRANPRPEDTPSQQEQARKAQEGREQRAADHATSRDRAATEAEDRRREFEKKQQAHARDQADAARKAAEAPAQRQAYEEKQRKAQEYRAQRERENATKTKPRSAPLPDPS